MSLLQWMAVAVAALVGWAVLKWIFTIPWTRQGRAEWRRVRDLTERAPYDYRYDPTLEELNASPRIISRYAGVKLAGLGWQVAGETVSHVMGDTRPDGLSRRLCQLLIKVGDPGALPGLLTFLNAFPKPVSGHGGRGSEWDAAAALGWILERCHCDVPYRVLKRTVRLLPIIAKRRRGKFLDLDALDYETKALYPANTSYDCSLRRAFHFAQEELERRQRANRRQPALHLTNADHWMRSREKSIGDYSWGPFCRAFGRPDAVATKSFSIPVDPPEHNGHIRVNQTGVVWLRGRIMVLDACPSSIARIAAHKCAIHFVDENNQPVGHVNAPA